MGGMVSVEGWASNLNHLGVDDSVIQRILRHSTVQVTQNHYIKTASPDAVAAMRLFSNAYRIVLHLCSKTLKKRQRAMTHFLHSMDFVS